MGSSEVEGLSLDLPSTYQSWSVEVVKACVVRISHCVRLTRLGGRILFLPLPAIIMSAFTEVPTKWECEAVGRHLLL